MTGEPAWLSRPLVVAIHERLLAEHGGTPGAPDEDRLAAALARPRERNADTGADPFRLAAAYAFGMARNRPFRDGNGRVALALAGTFLELHGWRLAGPEADAAGVTHALAAGELDEGGYALWLEEACAPVGARPRAGA